MRECTAARIDFMGAFKAKQEKCLETDTIEKVQMCTDAKIDFMGAFKAKQEKCLETDLGLKIVDLSEGLNNAETDLAREERRLARAEGEMESAKFDLAGISWDHVKCPEAMAALEKPVEGIPSAAAYANLKETETAARLTRTYERDSAIKTLKRKEWDYCLGNAAVERIAEKIAMVRKGESVYPRVVCSESHRKIYSGLRYPKACQSLSNELSALRVGMEFHEFYRSFLKWVATQAQKEADMKKFKTDYLTALASYENSLDATDRAALKAKFDDIKSCFADKATTNLSNLDATPSFPPLRFINREEIPEDETIGPCGTGSTDSVLQALDDARTNREIKRGNLARAKFAYEKNQNDQTLQAQYEQAKREFRSAQEQALAAYNSAKASHPQAPELNFNTWKEKNHWQSACWKEKTASFLGSSGSPADRRVASTERRAASIDRRVASSEIADENTNSPVATGPCGTGSTDQVLQALDDARTNREIKRGNLARAKSAYEKNQNDAALQAQYEQAKQAFQSAQRQASAAYNRARAVHPQAPELNFNAWKEKNHWQSACWKEKRANFLRRSSGSE